MQRNERRTCQSGSTSPGRSNAYFLFQHLFSRIWKYWFAAKSALSKLSLLFSVCAQLELVCFLRLYSNAAAVSNKVGPDFCKLSTFFHASAFLHFRNNTDIFSFPERFFSSRICLQFVWVWGEGRIYMSPSPPIRLCIWMQLPLQFWAQKSHSFYFADRSKTALDRPVNTGWDNPRAVVRKYERFAKSRPTHECEICLKYLDADRRRGKVDKSELTLFYGP